MTKHDLIIGRYDWLKSSGGPPRGERRYAILRVKKISGKGGTGKANLAAAIAHNLRERHTPNADSERFQDNTVLKGAETGAQVMQAWQERAPDKVRKNAVHALEYFVGASPEKMQAMSREQQDAFFRRALDWFEHRHGAENVLSAVIHRDETTPHMQVLVIPLDERGKLNARELIGGKARMSQMQTDFARDVGLSFGLERGRERSKATHQTIREYYGRANTPVEADFRLPERRRGAVLGMGRESDEEWRQRASEAAMGRLQHMKAHYEAQLAEIKRAAANLVGDMQQREAALLRQLGILSEDDRDTLTSRLNGAVIAAQNRSLSAQESRDLCAAAEALLGQDGMAQLRQGEISHLPGATDQDRAKLAGVILDADAATTGKESMAVRYAVAQQALPDQDRIFVETLEDALTPDELDELKAGAPLKAFARFEDVSALNKLDIAERYLRLQADMGLDRHDAIAAVQLEREAHRLGAVSAELQEKERTTGQRRDRSPDDGHEL